MGNEKTRREILERLRATFLRADETGAEISYKKLASEICVFYGFTEVKAREYIRILIDSNFIEQCGDTLIKKKKSSSEGQSILT